MDEAIGYLVGIVIVLVIIYFVVVYVVLPILGILIGIGIFIAGGIAMMGFVHGIFVGLRNFFEVLREAHEKLP